MAPPDVEEVVAYAEEDDGLEGEDGGEVGGELGEGLVGGSL